jgi:hypothetical protein
MRGWVAAHSALLNTAILSCSCELVGSMLVLGASQHALHQWHLMMWLLWTMMVNKIKRRNVQWFASCNA